MNITEHINKKALIGLGVLLLVLLSVFFYWFSGTAGTQSAITTLAQSPLDATLGRELLSALAKLKSTKLDTSIFNDPVFSGLKDFGVEIASQPVGRRNPFSVFDGTVSKKSAGGSSKAPAISKSSSAPPAKTKSASSPPPTPPSSGGFDTE